VKEGGSGRPRGTSKPLQPFTPGRSLGPLKSRRSRDSRFSFRTRRSGVAAWALRSLWTGHGLPGILVIVCALIEGVLQ
jgi:hypothetical protein